MNLKDVNYYFLSSLLLVLIGGVIVFPLSFLSNSNFIIGFVLFPFALFFSGTKKINVVYFILTILFGIAAYRYAVKIFYFFSLAFFLLFLIEAYIARLNSLVFFLLAFMSPFFHQVVTILGFPIRLKLSAWASSILSGIGLDINTEGNMMTLDGSCFSVDEACVGLNMLSIAMLMGVVALAHQYRTTKVRLSFPKLILFFLTVFGLNIFSNLLRILILVLFKIQPDNLLHDVTGILCLIGYVIVPIFFISRWMVLKMGSDNELRTLNGKNFRLRLAVLPLSFMLVFTGAHIHAEKKKTYNATPVIVKIPGFTSTHSDNGVTKLYNREVLIYIKPIAEFFSGEHTPLMCWKGSGYRFESIKRIDLDNKEIYVAQLVNGNRTLFTAWWYANGAVQTINQFDWRYRMLKGENKFSLINVTAGDKQTLYNNLKAILLINFAQPAFHQHSNYDASYL